MKRIIAVVVAVVMILGLTSFAMAGGWDKCKACHKETGKPLVVGGKPVLLKEEMTKKFKTAADFIKAAKDSTNPMMFNFKADGDLEAAAKDLGLQ